MTMLIEPSAEREASCVRLRIGDVAPDFTARSTTGDVRRSDYRGQWLILFSHPADFTPVCTTEFVALAGSASEFEERECALMALSVDSLFSHFAWLRLIHDRYHIERSEEHTSELQSLMRISYAVFCLKKNKYSK